MSANTLLLLAFSASVFLSFLASPISKLLAKRIDAIDRPSKRKAAHTDEVPRLGGIAIFFGAILSIFLFSKPDVQTIYIIIGASIITIAGMADDIFDINCLVKLFLQIACALFVISSGTKIDSIHLICGSTINTGVFSVLITLIWIVGLTNAFNMIDGLDGLACGVAILSSLALSLISFLCGNITAAISYLAISGACLGFLPYNLHPASIFMGDTGAMLIGFLISSFTVKFSFSEEGLSALKIILILAFPITEIVFTFFRRILKRKNPLKADNGHIHHILIAHRFSHAKAVLLLFVISSLFVLSSIVIFLLL